MNKKLIIIISVVIVGIAVAFGISDSTENSVDTVPTSPQNSPEAQTPKTYTLELREDLGMKVAP